MFVVPVRAMPCRGGVVRDVRGCGSHVLVTAVFLNNEPILALLYTVEAHLTAYLPSQLGWTKLEAKILPLPLLP